MVKLINIHIIEVPEGKERDKGAESLFKEIIVENFPKPGKKTCIQIQQDQKIPKS